VPGSIGFNEAAAHGCGKGGPGAPGAGPRADASMRPQHTAAEKGHARRYKVREPGIASMRPQHTAAEKAFRCSGGCCGTFSSFNEAAAHGCGKGRPAMQTGALHRPASMRPQHTAAEKADQPRRPVIGAECASMRPQHTAAEKGGVCPARRAALGASMRPQHTAAEKVFAIADGRCFASGLLQ